MPLPRLIRSATGALERLLDRVLCVCGAVLFSQLPEFMQQYLQALGGRLDELRAQLGRFREAASQSGMTLDQLVAGAAQNPDPSMGRMGAVVRALAARVDDLAAADAALRHATAWTRPFVFAEHFDAEIARGAWERFRPAVPATAEGILYAAAGVVLVLGAYHIGVRGPIARRLRKKAADGGAPPA